MKDRETTTPLRDRGREALVLTIAIAATTVVGCQSAEEECNEARVVAHDAWSAVVLEAENAVAEGERAQSDGQARGAARNRACTDAWTQYSESLKSIEGTLAIQSLAALAIGGANPCVDAAAVGVAELEQRLVAEGKLSQAIVARRDDAIAGAVERFAAEGGDDGRGEVARDLLPLASAARDAARGPAIAARDAYRAVPSDEASEALRAAISASEASWEACQSVDP